MLNNEIIRDQYDSFIQQTTHFQPRLILKIGGEDVTDRLIEDHSIVTDALLDTPTLNVYTTARVTFCLDNSDNAFNTKNAKKDENGKYENFFLNLERDADGWQTPVEISAVFEGNPGAPTEPKIFFVGYVEQVTELPSPRWVSVLVLEQSGLLQQAVVEDFGALVQATIGGRAANPNYSTVNPFFNLPPNSVPVSRDSLKARISGVELTVLPTLPRSGRALSERHVAVNENKGELHFGAEPEQGVNSLVDVTFKTAYRYRAPEALVLELLDNSGVYSEHTEDERWFAETFLEFPVIEHSSPQFSSHGRPRVRTTELSSSPLEEDISPVVRWIRSRRTSVVPEVVDFYMGGDRTLFSYKRTDGIGHILDKWGFLSNCPDEDAAILQFELEGSLSNPDFYVLTVNTWEGRAAKIWKVEGGVNWTEISGSNATATHFYDYLTQSDPAADNRKSFVIHRDIGHEAYLYYLFNTGTAYGVRRLKLSDLAADPETLFTRPTNVTPASTAFGINFGIVSDMLYVFWCERPPNQSASLQIFSMGVDGSNPQRIFIETFDDTLEVRKEGHPAMVTDVVERGGNLYFVLTFQSSLQGSGKAELSEYRVSENTREVLKTYDNSRYAARSLVVREEGEVGNKKKNIYFLEGTYLSAIKETSVGARIQYPTDKDVGHLGRIPTGNMPDDFGRVWESFRDPAGTGIGLHTAFCSNLEWNSLDDTLHFISGYGLISDSVQDTQQSQGVDRLEENRFTGFSRRIPADPVVASIDNWVWLQYGNKLSTKIPIFPTNDRTVWSLLEELARVVDFEIGFTSGQDEIPDFKMLYESSLSGELEPKGYFFFRPRGSRQEVLAIDESDFVNVSSRLDTTLIFNHISMPYGDGVSIVKEGADRFRSLRIENTMLTDNDAAWADEITLTNLVRQKRPRLKSRIFMKFSPQIALGQNIRITSEYHSLSSNEFRVTEIGHNLNSYQTELEMREDSADLFLPPVDDFRYIVGDQVSFVFPKVREVGGFTFIYEMIGLPSSLSFDSGDRELSGKLVEADVGIHKVVYTGRTTEDSPESVSVDFDIVVEAGVESGIETAWLGFAVVNSQAYVLLEDAIRVYSRSSSIPTKIFNLEGEWVDIAEADGVLYLLDTTSVKSISTMLAVGESTEDVVSSLDTDVTWLSLTVSGGELYLLGVKDNIYKFQVHPLSGSDPSEDFALDILADMSSIGSDDRRIYGVTYNSGHVLVWDIALKQWLPGSVIGTLLEGTWVGVDVDSDTVYALQRIGDRIIAVDAMSARQTQNDYLL